MNKAKVGEIEMHHIPFLCNLAFVYECSEVHLWIRILKESMLLY